MGRRRIILIWLAFALVCLAPIALAANSPLLQWREPIYIAAGFAGIFGLVILLVQPLLIAGVLPGIPVFKARRLHRFIGGLLVVMILAHVIGLWITSPPDVMDALTFTSPTPFSAWGVIAMWMVFATALLAAFRRYLHIRPSTWRLGHIGLAAVIVCGTVVHTLLIEGTMEFYSKIILCVLLVLALLRVVAKVRG